MALRDELVFRLEVVVGEALEVGHTAAGLLRVIPILGGTVSGGLEGTVLRGGADWNTLRPDGTVHLWARYEFRTADGAVVSVVNEAFHGPDTSPILTRPTFEVGEDGPTWLARGYFVGVLTSATVPGTVLIDVRRLTMDPDAAD